MLQNKQTSFALGRRIMEVDGRATQRESPKKPNNGQIRAVYAFWWSKSLLEEEKGGTKETMSALRL
jgi:hypothetical protein